MPKRLEPKLPDCLPGISGNTGLHRSFAVACCYTAPGGRQALCRQLSTGPVDNPADLIQSVTIFGAARVAELADALDLGSRQTLIESRANALFPGVFLPDDTR